MAKASYTKNSIFGNPGDFDVDLDGEYCGVIGGEMADRNTVGPVWDWRPDEAVMPEGQGNDARVLGQLDHSECHTAREGTLTSGSFCATGRQIDPVRRGTIDD